MNPRMSASLALQLCRSRTWRNGRSTGSAIGCCKAHRWRPRTRAAIGASQTLAGWPMAPCMRPRVLPCSGVRRAGIGLAVHGSRWGHCSLPSQALVRLTRTHGTNRRRVGGVHACCSISGCASVRARDMDNNNRWLLPWGLFSCLFLELHDGSAGCTAADPA